MDSLEIIEIQSIPPSDLSTAMMQVMIKELSIPFHLLNGEGTRFQNCSVMGAFLQSVGNMTKDIESKLDTMVIAHAVHHMLTLTGKAVYAILSEMLEPKLRVRPALAWQDAAYTSSLGEVFLLSADLSRNPLYRVILVAKDDTNSIVLHYIAHRDQIVFEYRGAWELADPKCFDRILESIDGISHTA